MNLQVGVKLLIKNEQGQYLFLRRAQSFKPGVQKWDIPGGRIEPNESLEEALSREVSEETGMELRGIPTLLAAQDIFIPLKDLHVVRLTYTGMAEGEVVISDEHSEFRWMTKTEALLESLDSYLLELKDRL